MATNNAINLGSSTFIARVSSVYSNVTGDGTIYTIIFNDVKANEGSCYNSSTGIFTAPEAGNYLFNALVGFTGIVSGMTIAEIYINGVYTNFFNAYNAAASGSLIFSGLLPITLSKGATVAVTARVVGGSKVVGIGSNSYFSGCAIL